MKCGSNVILTGVNGNITYVRVWDDDPDMQDEKRIEIIQRVR